MYDIDDIVFQLVIIVIVNLIGLCLMGIWIDGVKFVFSIDLKDVIVGFQNVVGGSFIQWVVVFLVVVFFELFGYGVERYEQFVGGVWFGDQLDGFVLGDGKGSEFMVKQVSMYYIGSMIILQ